MGRYKINLLAYIYILKSFKRLDWSMRPNGRLHLKMMKGDWILPIYGMGIWNWAHDKGQTRFSEFYDKFAVQSKPHWFQFIANIYLSSNQNNKPIQSSIWLVWAKINVKILIIMNDIGLLNMIVNLKRIDQKTL